MVYTIDEIRNKVTLIARKYHLSRVYLFGSYARGEADEDSDIDIAIEDREDLYDGVTFNQIITDVEDVFNVSIDLFTVEQIFLAKTFIGKMLKENFIKDNILLYDEFEETISGEALEQAKKEIQRLVKEKSERVRIDFSKKEDIDLFFGDEEFPEYEDSYGI